MRGKALCSERRPQGSLVSLSLSVSAAEEAERARVYFPRACGRPYRARQCLEKENSNALAEARGLKALSSMCV